ncbi:MAG: Sodium/proline symporter [bacterium ADurb.Bin270]|nr:MAG: Sodium/proline symporter [bacterium ADurb.Bin270]
MNVYLLAVIAYLALMIAISAYKSRSIKGQDDFMVSNRNVSTFMLVTTLIATWTGAGSLIGGAGLAYRQGFSELWMSVGAWFGILLVYWFAGRVRHISQFTLPDILEKRYNGFARAIGSLAIIIAYLTIVGYQLKGGAFVLELTTGIPWQSGVTVIAVFVILLTALAGMKSIVTIDLINGILIIAAIVVAVPILFFVGGFDAVAAALPPEHFSVMGGHNIIWALAVFFPVFLLLIGEPSMYQKFASARDEKSARRSVIGWIIGIIIVDTLICTLAILGRVKFPHLGADGNAERVILDIARFGLPTWAGFLLLAGALAIVFSTANSFLMAPATNATRDIIQRFIAKGMSEKTVVIVNRIVLIVFGLLSYLLITRFSNVLTMALTAYTMIGAAITPAVFAAFFWKRVTTAGGVSAIVGGMTGTIAAKILSDKPSVQAYFEGAFGIPGGELGEYIMIPAFAISVTLLIAVSLLGKKPPEEKWAVFFEKNNGGK